MNEVRFLLVLILLLSCCVSTAPGALFAGEAGAGETAFLAHKCNLCHGVEAAGIEAKAKSEKLLGPDLSGGSELEFDTVAAYLRQEAEVEGKEHKRPFKGSDEELQALLAWLSEQVASADEEQTEGDP